MNKRIDVSIIIPVYNGEKYISECLESIRVQTLESFEVLIIDDGSEDNSGKIAKEFAKKDERFKYTRLDRGGVANARNKGLQLAKGEYIGFVDCDDTVEPEYIETLYKTAKDNDCDISSCNYCIVRTKPFYLKWKVGTRKLKTGVYTKEFYLKHVIEDWDVRCYLWNKLWHRKLFFENNITFPKIYFEDIATVPRLAFHANKVAIADVALYNYFIRANSIMTSVKVEKINDYIMSFAIMKSYIQLNGELDTYKKSLDKLAKIIKVANHFNVFELHWHSRNFHGHKRNRSIADKNIMAFASDDFRPTTALPVMSEYIINPWDC